MAEKRKVLPVKNDHWKYKIKDIDKCIKFYKPQPK